MPSKPVLNLAAWRWVMQITVACVLHAPWVMFVVLAAGRVTSAIETRTCGSWHWSAYLHLVARCS